MKTDHTLIVDRYLGSVIGATVGDALGAGYEFTNPSEDDQIEMCGGGLFDWAPGEWTDDTQMTLGILKALAEDESTPVAIAANFIEWYESNPPDIGTQTRNVLGSTADAHELHIMSAAFLDANPGAAGNGALMRTSPVPLITRTDRNKIADFATEIASLTHAHKDSISACILWSLALHEAIHSGTYGSDFDWVGTVRNGINYLDPDKKERWEKLIGDTEIKDPRTFNPNGWVVTAFQAALSVIQQTPIKEEDPSSHFKDTLVNAVKIGDDTDTVASIAGAYLGAVWGKSAIPDEWIRNIHGYRISNGESFTVEDLQKLVLLAINNQRS